MAKTLNGTPTYDITNRLNKLLGTAIPQTAKAEICSIIEYILHRTDTYAGFNHLYWMDRGYREWIDAGQPGFPAHYVYIIGPNGAQNREPTSGFISEKEGEYARSYYLGKLWNKMGK